MQDVIILPDKRICLFCNTRFKDGNDDLCDPCARRWLLRESERPIRPDPRCNRWYPLDDISGWQANAIRILEEESQ
jgi:hypothetical protein